QGLFLSIEALTKKARISCAYKYELHRKSWFKITTMLMTFTLFSASQVFGRANNLSEALSVFYKIFQDQGSLFWDSATFIYASIGLVPLFMKDLLDEFYPQKLQLFNNKSIVIRYLA